VGSRHLGTLHLQVVEDNRHAEVGMEDEVQSGDVDEVEPCHTEETLVGWVEDLV
jgi:hypothetical protein